MIRYVNGTPNNLEASGSLQSAPNFQRRLKALAVPKGTDLPMLRGLPGRQGQGGGGGGAPVRAPTSLVSIQYTSSLGSLRT